MVQAGGVTTDYDKLIDRQLERATITCTAGFAKIFTEAAKTLS
ncbi:MAG: phage major capsid protein, partial [Ruminococcus sp.]|nr:phage major capsid protein [Ruminococcus sp.]